MPVAWGQPGSLIKARGPQQPQKAAGGAESALPNGPPESTYLVKIRELPNSAHGAPHLLARAGARPSLPLKACRWAQPLR